MRNRVVPAQGVSRMFFKGIYLRDSAYIFTSFENSKTTVVRLVGSYEAHNHNHCLEDSHTQHLRQNIQLIIKYIECMKTFPRSKNTRNTIRKELVQIHIFVRVKMMLGNCSDAVMEKWDTEQRVKPIMEQRQVKQFLPKGYFDSGE